jgi:hypothetical protein
MSAFYHSAGTADRAALRFGVVSETVAAGQARMRANSPTRSIDVRRFAEYADRAGRRRDGSASRASAVAADPPLVDPVAAPSSQP